MARASDPEVETNPANSLDTALVVISRLQARATEAALSDLGLNTTQAHILRFLYFLSTQDQPPPIQTEIAERLYYQKPATGVALDVLEAYSLIQRSPADHDRRAVTVSISPKGVEVAQEVEQRFRELNEQITACLSADEVAAFESILHKIRHHFHAARDVSATSRER